MASNAKFLGTTDEVDVCDCCGRKGLKSTVVLSIDDGEPVHFGVSCAARALSMGAKDVRREARAADDAAADARAAELQRLHDAQYQRRQIALDSLVPAWTGNRFRQLEALGGWAAAGAAAVAAGFDW